MARFSTTIVSPRPVPEAFAFMADLRNFATWDPGVRRVNQVAGSGGGPSAAFDVVVAAGRGESTFRYVTTRYEPDENVVVEASTRWFTSLDAITVAAEGSGSRVTYEAQLKLNGALSAFDLALRPMFRRIGERAAKGLAVALDGRRER